MLWYHGGHVSFLMEPTVRRLLREALSPRAMLDTVRDVERERSAAARSRSVLEMGSGAPRDFSLALAAQS